MSWILIHKPEGITSMSVTRRLKRLMGEKKVGHAGTLDPLATGVLPIALGRTTKLIPFLFRSLKIYVFTVRWGQKTTTDDSLGDLMEESTKRPSRLEIESILLQFTGKIQQRPPAYSAVNVQGQRAYHVARQQPHLILPAREVHIQNIHLLSSRENEAIFEVTCGTGTYVRSLARDMAERLGTLGHVTVLQRTRVGPFSIEECVRLDFFEKKAHKEREADRKPPQSVLDDIPVYVIGEKERTALWQGQAVSCESEEPIVACFHKGQLVALSKTKEGYLHPFLCFFET